MKFFLKLFQWAAAIAAIATVTATPGLANAQDIRIAHVYDKTGPLEAYARQSHTGLMMGLEYLTGGKMEINGRRLVVLEKDTQSKPDVGKAELGAAFGDDKADIAIGPVNSGVRIA